ncbi:MAG: hypothetical protein ACQESH_02785, partial [Campylobacterota bacterium]
NPVVDNLITIVDNIQTLTNSFAKEDSNFMNTMANLENFSARLSNNDPLAQLAVGKEGAQSIINSLHSLDNILKNLETTSQTIDKDIINPVNTAIGNIDTILLDLQQKLQKLDPMVDTVGGMDSEVKLLQEEIEYALIKSNQLLDTIDGILSDKDAQMELP